MCLLKLHISSCSKYKLAPFHFIFLDPPPIIPPIIITPHSTYHVCLSWTNLPSSSTWRTLGRRLRTRTRAVGRKIVAVRPPSFPSCGGPFVNYLRATCYMSYFFFFFSLQFTVYMTFDKCSSFCLQGEKNHISVFRTFGILIKAQQNYSRRRNGRW